MQRDDVAVAGVIGARAHCPALDIIGTPRVDLTLHSPNDHVDFGFVHQLDPGLMIAKTKDEPVALVIHVLRRKESLFSKRNEFTLADPVECLLDLNEMRLESQAKEFLDFFCSKRPPNS